MREILNKYSRSKFIHNTLYIIRYTKAFRLLALSITSVLLIAPFASVASEQLTSPNYILDPNVANSFGGFSETGRYQLLDSGGEAAIGLGDSGSYKLSSGYVAQLEQSIELNVLPEDLAGYWPLNTGVGIQAYDVTPNSNHGVLNNGADWGQGHVGSSSLQLNGTDGYVDIGNSFVDIAESTSRSISAWVNIANNSGTQRIITIYQANTESAFSIFRYNGTWQGGYRDTGGNWSFLDSGIAPQENTWTHVALTQSGPDLKLYINGQEAATVSDGGSSSVSNPHNATIGAYYAGSYGEFFNGRIDEVKVYSRALSEDYILDEYIANQQGIANALTLPRIGGSASQTVGADAIVLTDAPGYDLALSQDGNLRTDNDDEIPPISGSIMFPETWIEGTTTGFGFTIIDAIDRDGKWGTSPDYEYAAIPNTVSTFYSRSGLSGGAKEVTTLQFRLGVDGAQAAGVYTNRLGFTATLKP